MPDTEARIGYGTVLEIALASAPTVFTYIREMFDATPPADADNNHDATNMASPGKRMEYIPGLTDSGEAAFEMNYVPGSATDVFLRSIRGVALVARLTFANGVQILFNCNRQSYDTAVPNDDKMTATVTLKVSGEPYMSTPTAPRNLVAPTISGTAQVGVALTADGGDWAGATDLTYQWEADGVVVPGATSQTFVPLVGNLAAVITVVVTASNGTFSTVLESAATAAVIAA